MAKVRIRKAGPGETPGYYNKTSQFMQKAQAGGTSDPQAYMKQLQGAVYGALQRDQEPEEVYKALLSQKIDPKLANQVVSTVYSYMVENGEIEEAAEEVATEETAAEESAEATGPDAGREQMDQYRQQSMQEAMTEDEEGLDAMDDRSYLEGDNPLYDLFSTSTAPVEEAPVASSSSAPAAAEEERSGGLNLLAPFMETGGESNPALAQFNAQMIDMDTPEFTDDMETLIDITPGSQNLHFPGIEEYMYQYMPISDPYGMQPTLMPEAKNGGQAKKAFVKNVMGMLKKAEGGEGEPNVTAEQTDDLTGTVKKKKQSFIDTVKNTAKEVKVEEWFDSMQASGDPMMGQLENVLSGAPAPTPMAQKGGSMMSPREYRKLFKLLHKMGMLSPDKMRMPMSGFTGGYDRYGMPSFTAATLPDIQRYYSQFAPKQHRDVEDFMLPRINVEDTDIFGRPKRYSYEFARPAQVQANEAVAKNNAKASGRMPYEGYLDEGVLNPAPAGTMIDPQADMVYPTHWQNAKADPRFLEPQQYGGFADPSRPDLTMFAEGADTPQLAKNTDDPYSNDLVEAQFGKNIGNFFRGMSNNLLPINPFFNYAGSWQQQQGLPFNVGQNTAYTGSLEGATPVGRHVTKTSMLSRRPKEWVDYYQTPGTTQGTLYKGSNGQLQYFNPTQTDMSNKMQSDIDATSNKKRAGIDKETWDDLGLKSKMALKAKDLLYRGEQMFDQKPKAQLGNNPVSNNNFSNSFAAQPACPPGYYKDPSTGMCKNFAGETTMSNAASNASENFKTSADQMINQNPNQATGTNSLGQDYAYTKQDGTLGGMDLNYEGSFDKAPEMVGVEKKRKDMYNFSGEELVNASITGRNVAAGIIDGVRANKRNLQFQNENFNADKIYGSEAALDRGDWTQAGDFRTPEQGADWVNRSMAQYGGSFQEGGMPTFDAYPSDYTEGEEVWMTDDEIAQYLANGGEIEYL